MKFDRDPDQDRLVELFSTTDSGAALNGSGCGAGKTAVAVRTIAERNPERLIVIAQPNIYGGWRDTVKSVTGRELRFCGTAAKSGTSAKEAKANMEAAQNGEPGWYYVGREMFNLKNWRKTEERRRNGDVILGSNGKPKIRRTRLDIWGHWDVAVYDECQMLSSSTNYSHKSFANLDADFKMAQSADWFGSKLENMWSISNLLWPDYLDGQKQKDFIEDWLEYEYDHFAKWNIKVTGEQMPGMFAASLPAYAALPPAIEPPEPEKRYISLTRKERKLYDELNDYMAAELEGDLLVTEMHTTLYQRLRELCLGEFRVDYRTVVNDEGIEEQKQTIRYEVGDPSSTIAEIKAIIKDYPGESFIILTHSQKWAEKAAGDLAEADLKAKCYTGKQSISQKDKLKEDFLAEEVKILVGTEAMSEGLDGLQHVCRNAIIASRPPSYKTNQFLGRIARRGQKRAVNAWELVREDTIDVGVVARSIEKVLTNHRAKSTDARLDTN